VQVNDKVVRTPISRFGVFVLAEERPGDVNLVDAKLKTVLDTIKLKIGP